MIRYTYREFIVQYFLETIQPSRYELCTKNCSANRFHIDICINVNLLESNALGIMLIIFLDIDILPFLPYLIY